MILTNPLNLFLYQLHQMEYQLSTKSQLAYTYYTMAIYQNSYGMTDRRKPEFRLTVDTIETVDPNNGEVIVRQENSLMLDQSGENFAPLSSELEKNAGNSEMYTETNWLVAKLKKAMRFITQ